MFIICRIVQHVMLYILFYSDKKVTACAHGGTHPASTTDLSPWQYLFEPSSEFQMTTVLILFKQKLRTNVSPVLLK